VTTSETPFAIDPTAPTGDTEFLVAPASQGSAWWLCLFVPPVALILAVYIQIALAIDARVLGSVPDFALVVLVAIALRFGPAWGASAGFLTGVLFDISLQLPVGSSALVLTPIGWGIGVFGVRRRRVSLAMSVLVLLVAAVARIAGDVIVASAIGGQVVGWGLLFVAGTAGAMFTLLAGIVLLPLFRRVLGVPVRSVR